MAIPHFGLFWFDQGADRTGQRAEMKNFKVPL